EDSFSLVPAFKGAATTERSTLISHSIDGSFAMRQGNWKLCLSAGSGGWSAPREAQAKKQGLPPMQLFDLKADRGERTNLLEKQPETVTKLLEQLELEIAAGRSTPGKELPNDREITFRPKGAQAPVKK
ncbi:MAG: arylsulfatase, partial [Planctomycetota bacterium]|nr:arylsulfatase [Planctomycetota bacterium]